ncbi:hypothetical protein [Larkinella soli]|uniref:hypothetical protein n=1 Tax=Larkinella soli TaxID=1770527 RepID=UPI000FFBB1B1|nr:hypothetical protein [Larkinella soli]
MEAEQLARVHNWVWIWIGEMRDKDAEGKHPMEGRRLYVEKDFANELRIGDYLVIKDFKQLPSWIKAVDDNKLEEIDDLILRITQRAYYDDLVMHTKIVGKHSEMP